ncbi:uncharacterized protein [Mycetomoellerius zeteki]|uniref:uncharacterized protein isoform X1 n=1 Tax=Mycetomoellerius zeteki TaxID=64791 RepID=UPI00084EB38E|nr:PREDICTED: uncharacterized protein LOC108724031 isoform X1 [Trachymyrmex zeteki]
MKAITGRVRYAYWRESMSPRLKIERDQGRSRRRSARFPSANLASFSRSRYQESRARGTTISYLTFTLSGTETTKSVLDERSITPMTTTTTTTTTTINRSCRSGSDVQR